MDLIHLLVWLIVFCVVAGIVWYIFTLMPLPQPFKNIIMIVLCLIFLLILLSVVGILPGSYRLGSLLSLPGLLMAA